MSFSPTNLPRDGRTCQQPTLRLHLLFAPSPNKSVMYGQLLATAENIYPRPMQHDVNCQVYMPLKNRITIIVQHHSSIFVGARFTALYFAKGRYRQRKVLLHKRYISFRLSLLTPYRLHASGAFRFFLGLLHRQ